MNKMTLFLLVSMLSIKAQAFVVYDPSNWEQNLITAKNSIESLKKQVDMINLQLQSLKSLREYHYRDVGQVLKAIDRLSSKGQSISYAIEQLDEQFQKAYPNYTDESELIDYQQHAAQQNKFTLSTLKNSLASIGKTAQTLEEENQLLQQLNRQSQSSEGQKQVVQVTNELVTESIQQLQLLRRLFSIQANSQTAYMAHQVSNASYSEQTMRKLADNIKNHHGMIQSKGFGLMETRA